MYVQSFAQVRCGIANMSPPLVDVVVVQSRALSQASNAWLILTAAHLLRCKLKVLFPIHD
jgi:hypothetical protein